MKKIILLLLLSFIIFACNNPEGNNGVPDRVQFSGEYKVLRVYEFGRRATANGGSEGYSEELTNTCIVNTTLSIPANEQSFSIVEYGLDANNNCNIISTKNGVFTGVTFFYGTPVGAMKIDNDPSLIEFTASYANSANIAARFEMTYKISNDAKLRYVFQRI